MQREFNELMKQANYMQTKWSVVDDPQEIAARNELYETDWQHKLTDNPEYAELANQNREMASSLDGRYFEAPPATDEERSNMIKYPLVGGLGAATTGLGAVGLLRNKLKPVQMKAGVAGSAGLGLLGAMIGSGVAHNKYQNRAMEDVRGQMRGAINEFNEHPSNVRLRELDSLARNERMSNPKVQAFIQRYGYNPFDYE